MIINVPAHAHAVIHALERAGYEAYAVGGCVRDTLLGRDAADWDVCTSARPEEMKAVFEGFRIVETGLQHGTLTVIAGDSQVEVTTFRSDGEYSDSRRPDQVRFVRSLQEDLARRDFTINAMAWSEKTGLVDFYGGRRDLERGIVRCVGDAQKRFTEDALRIMRALRFAATLDFKIEFDTAEAAVLLRKKLLNISAERVSAELLKLLCGDGAGRILLEYTDILAVWIPELLPMRGFAQNHPCHMYDVLMHTAAVVDAAPKTQHMRLAALLHDVGKPSCYSMDEKGIGHFRFHAMKGAEMAKEICARLRLDKARSVRICDIVRWHDHRSALTERDIRLRMSRITPEVFFETAELCRADMAGKSELGRQGIDELEKSIALGMEIIERGECLTRTELAIDGKDLMKLGMKPSKQMGRLIDDLLEAVLEGRVANDKGVLLTEAEKRIKAQAEN